MMPMKIQPLCSSLVQDTASERMPRLASAITLASTASEISARFSAISSRICGAPFITLNVLPSLRWMMASVRLMVGLKGV